MTAPEPGHRRRDAIDGTGRQINAFDVGIVVAGKHAMAVAKHDRINVWHPGQVVGGLFLTACAGTGRDSGMRNGDDDIGAFERNATSRRGITLDDQQAAMCGGTGRLTGVAGFANDPQVSLSGDHDYEEDWDDEDDDYYDEY